MADAVVVEDRPTRGSDARKAPKNWDNLEPIADFGEYALYELRTKSDLSEEGKLIRNCAGGHDYAVEKGAEMLLSLRDKETQTPHCTVLLTNAKNGGYSISTYKGMVECITLNDTRYKVNQASLRGSAAAVYKGADNSDKQQMYLDIVLAWLQSLPHEVTYTPREGEYPR